MVNDGLRADHKLSFPEINVVVGTYWRIRASLTVCAYARLLYNSCFGRNSRRNLSNPAGVLTTDGLLAFGTGHYPHLQAHSPQYPDNGDENSVRDMWHDSNAARWGHVEKTYAVL